MLELNECEFKIQLDLDRFRLIMQKCFDFDSTFLSAEEKEWFDQFRSFTYAKSVNPDFSQVILQVSK